MKKLTRFFATCVVVLAISAVTFAGEMQTPGAPQQAPPPPPPDENTTSLISSIGTYDAVVDGVELMATWFLNSF